MNGGRVGRPGAGARAVAGTGGVAGARRGSVRRAMAAPPAVAEAVAGAVEGQRRLAATLASLDDATARGPSLLPGWTVGHVLTHLARNADSHVRALEGGRAGEVVDRYPGGPEQRTGEIEAGAARPATRAGRRRGWPPVSGSKPPGAPCPATCGTDRAPRWAAPNRSASLPFRRWREVEVHHVDLGLGYRPRRTGRAATSASSCAHATMAWRASRPMGLTDLPAGRSGPAASRAVGVAAWAPRGSRPACGASVVLTGRSPGPEWC